MNRKFKLMLLCLIFIPCIIMLSACQKEDPKATSITVDLMTTSYSMNNNEINTTYGSKVSLNKSDFKVTANLDNGSTKVLDAKDYSFESTLPTTETTPAGDYIITISYLELNDVVITINVNKAVVSMVDVNWNYKNPFTFDGEEKQVELTNLPNGVTVTYEGTTNATKAGTYTAKANFTYTDTANYDTIPSMELTWKINKATVASFDNVSLEQNEFAYTGLAHEIEVLGIPVGAKIQTITNNIASVADEYLSVVTFVCDDSGNYEQFTPVTKEFSWKINPANLVISANNSTISYGEEAKDNGYTASGFVNGETKDILKGNVSYSYGSYSTDSNVGDYDIIPSGLYADNYTISFVKGTLTVEPLMVDVANVSWPTNNKFEYTGSEIKPELVSIPLGVVASYTYTPSNAIDTGDYVASVVLTAQNNNYVLVNNNGVANFSYTIFKEETGITALPTNTNLVLSIGLYSVGFEEMTYDNNGTYTAIFAELNSFDVAPDYTITIDSLFTDLNAQEYKSSYGDNLDITSSFTIPLEMDNTGVITVVLADGSTYNIVIRFADSF